MLEPNQLQPPSPEPAPAPAGEVSPPPADAGEEPTEDRSWWSRFLHTRGHHTEPSDDASPPASNGHAEPIAPGSPVVTLTEEELNQRVARQAQSLVDRETARRNREAAEAERRRLRDEDPWRYAQQDKEREDTERVRTAQTQQLIELLGHTARQYDAATLDPIWFALPEKERERIQALPHVGEGLEGRKLIVSEVLKTHGRLEYERGYREAQAKLRRDPVFRKSVLAEQRGSYEEPELYPGNGSPTTGLGDENVSSILRRQYQGRG